MKQVVLGIVLILFSHYTSHAQFFKHTIVKTKLLQDIVAFNPNLVFEKPLSNKISVELDFMYRNRVWNSTGQNGDFGKFYQGDGFKLLGGSKLYFGKANKQFADGQKAPFGWFVSFQLAYSMAITHNIANPEIQGDNPPYYFDSRKNWGNINLGIGKQFYLFKTISMEFFVGPTYRTAFTEYFTPIDGSNAELEYEEYRDAVITLFGTWSIGYFFK